MKKTQNTERGGYINGKGMEINLTADDHNVQKIFDMLNLFYANKHAYERLQKKIFCIIK